MLLFPFIPAPMSLNVNNVMITSNGKIHVYKIHVQDTTLHLENSFINIWEDIIIFIGAFL